MAQLTVNQSGINNVSGENFYVFIDNNGILSEIQPYTGTVWSSNDIWAYDNLEECENKHLELTLLYS